MNKIQLSVIEIKSFSKSNQIALIQAKENQLKTLF